MTTSCSEDEFIGNLPEESREHSLEDESNIGINSFGNLFIITANGNNYSVAVDSVKASEQVIDLNDSTYLTFDRVDFSRFADKVQIIGSEVIEIGDHYYVKNLDCQLNLSGSNVLIPIKFKRQVVGIMKTGEECSQHYSFSFKLINASYCGSDPLITNEETHSRTYYDLVIEAYDKDYSLGTIKTRVSFYTANIPISFDMYVDDLKDVYCSY